MLSTIKVLQTVPGKRVKDAENSRALCCWLFHQMSQQGLLVVSYSRTTLRCTMTNCRLRSWTSFAKLVLVVSVTHHHSSVQLLASSLRPWLLAVAWRTGVNCYQISVSCSTQTITMSVRSVIADVCILSLTKSVCKRNITHKLIACQWQWQGRRATVRNCF